jgi:putative transposase
MLPGVRWSGADPGRTRHGAERMRARGVHVAHSPRPRGVVTSSPPLDEAFHRRQRPVWGSWRLAEPASTGQGAWQYLSRAVDQEGQTIALLRPAPRDTEAALQLRTKARRRHGRPATSTLDGRDAHAAASKRSHAEHGPARTIRQGTSRKHLVEQDHRSGKRVTRPRLGLPSCAAAQDPRVGSERRPLSKKRPLGVEEGDAGLTAAAWFYSLTASLPDRQGLLPLHNLRSQICDIIHISPSCPRM